MRWHFFTLTLIFSWPLSCISPLLAQLGTFQFADLPVVTAQEAPLSMPWAGGLNSAQTSTIDLNADGITDLAVFDRTTNKVSVFMGDGTRYAYAPEWEVLFPKMEYWMLLIDFNGDGKKELFTGSGAGIRVFKDVSEGEALPQFELFKDPIKTFGFSEREINLKVDVTDIPAIADIDGDGDMDILNFAPAVGGRIEYHRNNSMETYGHADSLVFIKMTDRWGNFTECGTCNTYLFEEGAACRVKAEEHAGSAILAFNANGDATRDVLLGEVSCNNLVQLLNVGTPSDALFNAAITDFPPENPVDIQVFPAPFYEDVDFDGVKDLLVSPNLFFNEGNLSNFHQSNWYYKNVGTNEMPNFEFQQKDFLQAQMLDFGESPQTVFYDVDQDEDTDLIVANRGMLQPDGTTFVGSFWLLLNTATEEAPVYKIAQEDYLGIKSLGLIDLKPQMADLNNDGQPDLYFSARKPAESNATIYYLLNQAADGTLEVDLSELQQFEQGLSVLGEPHFFDTDSDGDLDLLVGNLNGSLEHYENIGNDAFNLINGSLGGIGFNTLRRELSIEVADLDADGQPDLITGDRSGEVKIYSNFLPKLNGLFEAEEGWFFNATVSRFQAPNFGNGVYPTVHRNLLALGSAAGGIQLLRSDKGITALPMPNPTDLSHLAYIFPNPAQKLFTVAAKHQVWISVFDLNGKLVQAPKALSAGETMVWKVSGWQPGIYFVKANSNKAQEIHKLLVMP